MAARRIWPSRPISNTITARPAAGAAGVQFSLTLRSTTRRYHVNGRSDAESVRAPTPCAEPVGRPSGGTVVWGTGGAVAVGVATGRLGVGGESGGSSFSPGLGRAA